MSASPTVYLPATQAGDGFFALVHGWFTPKWIVRSTRPIQDVTAGVRQALTSADANLPIVSMRSMRDVVDSAVGAPRVQAVLTGLIAALALVLAAIGIYGLIATSVTERTRELGIRLALGASVSQVVRGATIPGVALAVAGLVAGGAVSLWLVQFLDSLVWGIEPTDPTTFVAMSAVLLGTAIVASVLPSIQIIRLDPSATLRDN